MTSSHYWDYLSPHQRDLIREGSYIYQEIFSDGKYNFQDYSFLVFPFAKAFEGFIKQFLLDISFISYQQYNSDHIRIGRLLCPELASPMHGESIYSKLVNLFSKDFADMIWTTWKFCRNQVFHYYPHNSKSLDLNGAKERIHMILTTMSSCYNSLNDHKTKSNDKFDRQNNLHV